MMTDGAFDLGDLSRRLQRAGVSRAIGIRHICMGAGALHHVPDVVEHLLIHDATGTIVLLDDGVRKERGGEDVVGVTAELLGNHTVKRVVIETAHGRVHADARTLDEVSDKTRGAACLVTIGSGTIADIGKAVSARRGNLPHVVVQTALSVNGYADDQSVLLVDGVKRTTPTRWPDALIADTETLAAAPVNLNLAGVGDLSAMFTAPADWRLANMLGMGDGYAPGVVSMVREHGTLLLKAAPDLAKRDVEAIELVARVLTLSGISMGVAGTTAPSSGMEHTVSHLIEMSMNRRGLDSAFHGAQVGTSAILALILWQRVRASLAANPRPCLEVPSEQEMEPHVRAAFYGVDPSGSMGAECWRLYRRKLLQWQEIQPALAAVDWQQIDAAVEKLLIEPEELVQALSHAGAAIRFRDLEPPIDAETVRWALTYCHLVRDRFTVADLAYFLGVWGPDDAEAVLQEAAALGAGL